MAFNILLFGLFLSSLYILVSSKPIETMYYSQTLDHFTSGTRLNQETFSQRFHLDCSFWSGPGGPLLVLLGGEAPLDSDGVSKIALISESAPRLSALIIAIEHRFYGISVPYGSIDMAMSDYEVRGCLTTSQALADFKKIIYEVKKNLSTMNSPVIVMGGSYSGILAALFRMRYPGEAIGAMASSAPMYFDFIHSANYYSDISQDFQEINHDCHEIIQQSWKLIDDMAKGPGGLDYLSQMFASCNHLHTVEGLKAYLADFYIFTAQYNGRYSRWINYLCNNVVDPPNENVIEGIARSINGTHESLPECFDINVWAGQGFNNVLDVNSSKAWEWQYCTELVIPFHSDQETMFPVLPFNLSQYMANCAKRYGVPVLPWVADGEQSVGGYFGDCCGNKHKTRISLPGHE